MDEKFVNSLNKTISVLPILLAGLLDRTFFNILPMQIAQKRLEQVEDPIRLKRYSYRTKGTYI
jgi:hypothetical protein